jgi:hypothetical protein
VSPAVVPLPPRQPDIATRNVTPLAVREPDIRTLRDHPTGGPGLPPKTPDE